MSIALMPNQVDLHRINSLMRRPEDLMRPEVLAAFQPSRVSASRALMARAIDQRWKISREFFDIDDLARGRACYRIDIGGWQFSFPVFSFQPSASGRSGRIIGRAWDMMGALVEGTISSEDFAKTGEELPKLYEGRATPGTLIWCRSNRSSRLFDLAMQSLANGRQPPVADLATTCYLMRNTGLDGNGTFGSRSFLSLEKDHPLRWSLAAQMLCAYLMRVFASDLLRHLALKISPKAVEMAPPLARFLGVGNGSALGLMLYVNNHPRLIDRWIWIREQSIAHAKALTPPRDGDKLALLLTLLDKAIRFRREDRAEYEAITASNVVADDLSLVRNIVEKIAADWRSGGYKGDLPFADICATVSGRVSREALETVHSLLIELVPDVADRLVETLVIDEELVGRPEMTVGRLRELVRQEYGWAFGLDLSNEASSRYVWYKSATAEEPRRGPRADIGEAVNLGLDLPRMIVALDADLRDSDASQSTARFLVDYPHHRAAVTRAQALHGLSFHSPAADIMSEDFVPAHITRLLNVGLHGIDKTRDFLNRNLRGVLFHGAPTASDLIAGTGDPHWFYPAEPEL